MIFYLASVIYYSDSHCGGSQANKRHIVLFLKKSTGSQIVFLFSYKSFGEALFSKNVKKKKNLFLRSESLYDSGFEIFGAFPYIGTSVGKV